jgi:hypothetical protein
MHNNEKTLKELLSLIMSQYLETYIPSHASLRCHLSGYDDQILQPASERQLANRG